MQSIVTLIVNYDAGRGSPVRLNTDAEVDTIALLSHWTTDAHPTKVVAAARDLIFPHHPSDES